MQILLNLYKIFLANYNSVCYNNPAIVRIFRNGKYYTRSVIDGQVPFGIPPKRPERRLLTRRKKLCQ